MKRQQNPKATIFVQSFKADENNSTRNSFVKYYMPLVKLRDSNAFIDNKQFSNQPVTNKQEAYQKLVKMSRNNDYTAGNLLDYS